MAAAARSSSTVCAVREHEEAQESAEGFLHAETRRRGGQAGPPRRVVCRRAPLRRADRGSQGALTSAAPRLRVPKSPPYRRVVNACAVRPLDSIVADRYFPI